MEREGVRKCWAKTRLPQAATSKVKDEAISRVRELFKDGCPDDGYVEPGEEPDATDSGAPVDDPYAACPCTQILILWCLKHC